MKDIVYIDLKKLVKSPYNVRVEASMVGDLAKNIKKNGLQQPIVVRPVKDKYEVVEGNRRWRAFEVNQMKKIPAIVEPMSDSQALKRSLSENIMRSDISIDEKARAIAICLGRTDLLKNEKIKLPKNEVYKSERELAKDLGLTHQAINSMLEPLRQQKETRELVKDGRITEAMAKNIRQFAQDGEKEVKLAKAIAQAELKVIEVNDLLMKARKNNKSVDDVIKELKGKTEVITEAEVKDNKIDKTKVVTGVKKDVVSSVGADELLKDIINEPTGETTGEVTKEETISVTIDDNSVVTAIQKYADEKKITVEDVVIKAVKKYLIEEKYLESEN